MKKCYESLKGGHKLISVFWSPKEGSGTTSSMLLIGIILAWKLKKKVILLNTAFQNHDMEKYLIPVSHKNMGAIENTGVDVLLRSMRLRELNVQNIENSALSLYSGNLQVIPGTFKISEAEYCNDMMKFLPSILEELNNLYDYVLIDTPCGRNDVSEALKRKADRIIVNLSQCRHVIGEYFDQYHTESPELPGKQDNLYMIGSYDKDSAYNIKNLERLYKPLKKRITAVPYNTDLKDAISDAAVIEYLQKNINVEGENQNLIQELLKVSNQIIEKGGKKHDVSGADC